MNQAHGQLEQQDVFRQELSHRGLRFMIRW